MPADPYQLVLVGALGVALIVVPGLLHRMLEAAKPALFAIASERMPRLVARETLTVLASAVVVGGLLLVWGGLVPDYLEAAGKIAVVSWARSALAEGSGRQPGIVVLLALTAVLAILAQYVLFRAFGRRRRRMLADRIGLTTGRAERFVHATSAILAGGIGEEFIFRAVLPAAVYAFTGSLTVAILAPWLLFALAHIDQRWTGITNAALIGLACTVVYLATERLEFAIAVHVVANILAVLVAPEVFLALRRRTVRRALRSGAPAHREG
ncbi:CPBP family intramembrane glutamic endopeptidase [Agromyces allii]|uniref:CAAX prenyl protease 2/Lysostaphin resistance protein A-like domain-containing protein n=1 Tax=Agromyces allii TaxID=393607 RepID=A0ABP5BY45_9MICO|nr:CPBP family intramembrane glutamic endopeptidase [Agromyces allii]